MVLIMVLTLSIFLKYKWAAEDRMKSAKGKAVYGFLGIFLLIVLLYMREFKIYINTDK